MKKENKSQPSFILYASKYVIAAQEAEVQENYLEAFENYKKAIDVLLQGTQSKQYFVVKRLHFMPLIIIISFLNVLTK